MSDTVKDSGQDSSGLTMVGHFHVERTELMFGTGAENWRKRSPFHGSDWRLYVRNRGRINIQESAYFFICGLIM